MLIAPFTWPFANAFGPRTSTTIKSGLADFRDSCTSQQSVSNASISWKCLTASSDGAAAVSVTCVVMVAPSGIRIDRSTFAGTPSHKTVAIMLIRHAQQTSGSSVSPRSSNVAVGSFSTELSEASYRPASASPPEADIRLLLLAPAEQTQSDEA